MITRRGSTFLQTELKHEPTPRVVRAILKDINNRLEHEPQPSPTAPPESVVAASACSTTSTRGLEGALVVGGQKRPKDDSVGKEQRKRQKTTDDGHCVPEDIDPEKKILREICEVRKEAAERERALNETLLKAAEVELEGKREFWRTKNRIAVEELEKASAEKEATLAQRVTALLNRNVAIANYNRVNGKKIKLPSPPDM